MNNPMMRAMPRLVFLHGWGQSSRIWFAQREAFPDALFLDLPGHGGAPESDDWVSALAGQLPDKPCILVGWSLGGMLAMQLAKQYPERIAALALVSTTPRFRNGNGWDRGCSDEVFNGFADGVAGQSAKTLGRFFALMLHGDDLSRADFNQLARQAVDRNQPPTGHALEQGLALLADLDLRDTATEIRQPVWVLHGENDAIIPAAAGQWLAGGLPAAEWQGWPQCGHAPFLSRPGTFNQQLRRQWEAWCRTISIAA